MSLRAVRQLPFLLKACAGVVMTLLAMALINPALLNGAIESANKWIYQVFGGFYLWFTLLTTLGFVLLGSSSLGKLKLGKPDDQPEFGFWSWFSMIFCAGMGTGFMFWGAAEPLYHFIHPPYADAMSSLGQKNLAFGYTFFHWGLSPWAIYGMTAVAMGFFCYNQQRGFRFSSFLTRPSDPGSAGPHPALRNGIDLITILSIVFGLAATMGMGVLNIEGGLKWLLHTEGSRWLEMAIMGGICTLFLLSAVKGMQSGIRLLSNISMLTSLLLLASLMVVGPQARILASLVDGIGTYLVHFLPMSLGMGDYQSAAWVGEWTVKYWSWWIAWAPFVGLFLVLISRGRTIREIMLATLIAPTLFSCLWFAVFGQSALGVYYDGGFANAMPDFSNVDRILYQVLDAYFKTPLIAWLSILLITLFVVNSADSATYTIACLSQDDPDHQPKPYLLACWGLLFFTLTLVLLITGGIMTLNQITTISVLPFTFLLVAVYGVFLRALIGDRLKNRLQLPAIGSEKCPDPSP